jgi:hypothetical protein
MLNPECDQLRVSLERLRSLLETLVVRGVRACGSDELCQLQSLLEDLDASGAGYVASILSELHTQIQKADRAAPRTLLMAQTSVRMLERLLTLRVAKAAYAAALQASEDALELDKDIESDEDNG